MNRKLFSKTFTLYKFSMRRDRLRNFFWILGITLMTFVVTLAFTNLYPTEADRMQAAIAMDSPAVTMMFGPAFGIENYH